MARPEIAALHDPQSSPCLAGLSGHGVAAPFPLALQPTACPPRAADEGRASTPFAPDAAATSDAFDGVESGARKGAKRGPKPARGRLILLPAQFFEDPQAPLKMPERRLMLAVLADAVQCVRKYKAATRPSERALFNDARRWLMARDTERDRRDDRIQLTFEYVCEVLGLDADAVRSRL